MPVDTATERYVQARFDWYKSVNLVPKDIVPGMTNTLSKFYIYINKKGACTQEQLINYKNNLDSKSLSEKYEAFYWWYPDLRITRKEYKEYNEYEDNISSCSDKQLQIRPTELGGYSSKCLTFYNKWVAEETWGKGK